MKNEKIERKQAKKDFYEKWSKDFFNRQVVIFNHGNKFCNDKRVIIYREGYSNFHFASFETVKQFKDFIKLFNIDYDLDFITDYGKNIKIGRLTKRLTDGKISFWKLSEIPTNSKKTKALSNGSIVDCYINETEKEIKLYRPNPNAKDIYNPLSLKNHIRFQARFGIY